MATGMAVDSIRPGEEERVVELVLAAFDRFVAPCFSQEGIAEFRRYADIEALRERLQSGAVILTAKVGKELVGVAEIRDYRHLGWLFAGPSRQGKGIGSALMNRVVELCSGHEQGEGAITVNSSPNAVGFYEKMGFVARDEEQTVNGIRFVPMRLVLDS